MDTVVREELWQAVRAAEESIEHTDVKLRAMREAARESVMAHAWALLHGMSPEAACIHCSDTDWWLRNLQSRPSDIPGVNSDAAKLRVAFEDFEAELSRIAANN